MDDQVFKAFEIQANETARAINLSDKYTVISRFPRQEFASSSGMNLKNDYWVQRIVDVSMINLGVNKELNIFKLITNNIINYVIVKDASLTKDYKGKLYLSFEFKNKLQNIYNFDKIFTLYWGEGDYKSMYGEEQLELVKEIWK